MFRSVRFLTELKKSFLRVKSNAVDNMIYELLNSDFSANFILALLIGEEEEILEGLYYVCQEQPISPKSDWMNTCHAWEKIYKNDKSESYSGISLWINPRKPSIIHLEFFHKELYLEHINYLTSTFSETHTTLLDFITKIKNLIKTAQTT